MSIPSTTIPAGMTATRNGVPIVPARPGTLRLRLQNGAGGQTTDFPIDLLGMNEMRSYINNVKTESVENGETCEIGWPDQFDPDPENHADVTTWREFFDRVELWFPE